MIARAGEGAPLVRRSPERERGLLVAMAARDRRELAEGAIRSTLAAFPRAALLVHLDPLSAELTAEHVQQAGARWIRILELPRNLPPRARVARMRADAARAAETGRFRRILYADADIRWDPAAAGELERLWALRPDCHFAVSLARYAGYDGPGYARASAPLERAMMRSHGLGMALAFEVTPTFLRVASDLRAARGEGCWDSELCLRAVRGVVTPERSWALHLGRTSVCNPERVGAVEVAAPTEALAAGR